MKIKGDRVRMKTICVARAAIAALFLGLAGLTDLGAAFAQASQTPGPQGQPTPREERPDVSTPSARSAESYNPIGVPLGSFRLFPSLELDAGYNDNVFATSSAFGQTGSFIQVVKPSLELRSDWNNHMLNLYARGAFGFYDAAPSVNYQDFAFGADGRLDIQRNWNTYGGLSYNRRHEDPGSPNTVLGFNAITKYDQISGNLGYFQKFNRLSGRLEVNVDNFNFFNNGLGLAQGVVPNSDLNRTEFHEALRFGYEYLNGFEVWTRGSLNQRRYVNFVDSAGFIRDSAGWDLVGGVSFDFGGVTSLEVFAGYVQQNYEDVRFRTLQGLMFGATGYWRPAKELLIKPFISRTVQEAAFIGDSGYLSTVIGVEGNYNLRPNVRLDGYAGYSVADYQSIATTSNRYDQYGTFRASILYMPSPQFFIGPQYQYIHLWSNQSNFSYGQNVIMLRLGARL
jgi:hypothetical protein